jgi:hypothetical protein
MPNAGGPFGGSQYTAYQAEDTAHVKLCADFTKAMTQVYHRQRVDFLI